MENYNRVLTDEELARLSNKDRREYLRQRRSTNNQELLKNIHSSEQELQNISFQSTELQHKKKSNAGRKKIDDSEKKQQLMITIEAESNRKLQSVDKKNYKKLLSRYIDKNIDSIVDAMQQL